MVLIEGAGNPYLVAAYGLIAAKIGALRTRAHDDAQVVDRSLKTHRRLLELLEEGDADAFCGLLEFHIRNTGRDYRAWLARQADAGSNARGAARSRPANSHSPSSSRQDAERLMPGLTASGAGVRSARPARSGSVAPCPVPWTCGQGAPPIYRRDGGD